MIILLSPSKRLDFNAKRVIEHFTIPQFMEESSVIMETLRKYSPAKLVKLMSINSGLARENYDRFQSWNLPFEPNNSIPAIFAFKGEVYHGLVSETLKNSDLEYAQEKLRILSGLHGILKPFDLIRPYRLEMGTKLKVGRNRNLYTYWATKITESINNDLAQDGSNILVNLASVEYFMAVDTNKLNAEIITPQFLDFKNGSYKFLTVYGKKARGRMARFIIENRISKPEELKLFDADGYYYNFNLSKDNSWVFTRG
ncbi:MAG: peroxide stress protein YaaA [Bacteroidales bacterium]|nr:peroxide stress protein YaaA [Bacteroidales bacterium]